MSAIHKSFDLPHLCCWATAALCLCVQLSPLKGSAATAEALVPLDESLGYRSDRLLVQPKPHVDPVALANLHSSHGCRVIQSFPAIGNLQIIATPSGQTIRSLEDKYKGSGLVEYAEPDYIRHLNSTEPDDPKYLDGTLWGLHNNGQNGGVPHADISAPEAWDIRTSASNMVVAILDTGVRYTHEDLTANIWTNSIDGSHGTNAIAGTSDPNDDQGHGTLMAGVIGAVGNNGKGITGVAWRVQIMACKCFSSSGAASDSGIIACIDYARANGAHIISASFDGTGFSESMSNAIFTARSAGVIFVASAGNNSANIDITPRYPASYGIDNIVSVAYTARNDTLGSFSNYGATNVDLAAPGDQIYSTFSASDISYYPPPGLPINLAGTSFGAAYVSGALALMLTKFPGETHGQIISRLLNATDPLPALSGKCASGGRLNLYHALSPPMLLSAIPTVGDGLVHWRLSAGPRRLCVIQTSTNLLAWSSILTNTTPDSGLIEFSESHPVGPAQRFYRAVSTP
jgi:subtilisin family serine protease